MRTKSLRTKSSRELPHCRYDVVAIAIAIADDGFIAGEGMIVALPSVRTSGKPGHKAFVWTLVSPRT